MQEENLVFIISQPRSGSTFLQNILSNNSRVNTCSEPWILLNYANQIKPKLVEGTFDNTFATGAFYNYKEANAGLDANQALKQHLLSLYEPLKQSFDFVIDKTPRYWEIIDEIAVLFPKARIIVLKRDPMAVVASLVKTYQMTTLSELVRFKRDLLYAPKKLEGFCKKQQHNKQVYSLRYEDFVNDTQNQTRELYHWLGVDFDAKVLDTSDNTKHKGHFGDPFQNESGTYQQNKEAATKHVIKKDLLRFVEGYSHYLGAEFLKQYGNYSTRGKEKNTGAFTYFKFLSAHDTATLEAISLKNLFKKMYFSIKFK
ncbi:MAG: sulfotransferase [Gilvibacter sp.]